MALQLANKLWTPPESCTSCHFCDEDVYKKALAVLKKDTSIYMKPTEDGKKAIFICGKEPEEAAATVHYNIAEGGMVIQWKNREAFLKPMQDAKTLLQFFEEWVATTKPCDEDYQRCTDKTYEEFCGLLEETFGVERDQQDCYVYTKQPNVKSLAFVQMNSMTHNIAFLHTSG